MVDPPSFIVWFYKPVKRKLSLAHQVSQRLRTMLTSDQGIDVLPHISVQFQYGMSLTEFLQCFATESACAEVARRNAMVD